MHLLSSRPRPRLAAGVIAAALATTTLAACASGTGAGAAAPASAGGSAYRGDRLATPERLSSSALHDAFRTTAGGTTTLAELQQHKLMLVYFGYTHCPDVCPTTMADLGVALRQLPNLIQARTQVVFITSDPQRDTVPVMKAWLAHFDPTVANPFVGLTATTRQIDAVAKSVGVPIGPPVRQSNGTISVQHGAQTLAFINGKAQVLWTAGTQPADYEHDITALAGQVTPS